MMNLSIPNTVVPRMRPKFPELGHVVTPEQIEKLQSCIMQMPQAEPVTEHFIHEGMYCRRVWRKAGTVVVGKVHKKPHFFVCVEGELIAWSEKGMRRLKPGDVICSMPGTKRVTYAVKDSVAMTFHVTPETEIEAIENDLVEDCPEALFGPGNVLKDPVLTLNELEHAS